MKKNILKIPQSLRRLDAYIGRSCRVMRVGGQYYFRTSDGTSYPISADDALAWVEAALTGTACELALGAPERIN